MADPTLKPGYVPGAFDVNDPTVVLTRGLPALVTGNQWTPAAAFAKFFDRVEIRSKFTPTLEIAVKDLESPEPSPLMQMLKPAFVFRGPAGVAVAAPYGYVPDAKEGGTRAAVLVGGVAATLFGLGFLTGALRARRKAKQGKL